MKRICLAVFFLLCGAGLAWGGATIETTFKSGGVKGMGAAEGTTVRRYLGEKMWESTTSKFTGAILSRVAGGSESVTITRIDKSVYWSLDPKKKIYSERPIEPFDKKDFTKEQGDKEKPTVRITKSEFTVKKTGATETINGFPCEEYLLTWFMELENMETKEKSQSTMVTNLWTTPETATIRKVQQEEMAFHTALAKKVGLNVSPEEAKQFGMGAFAGLTGAPPEEVEKGLVRMKNEMAKVKGFTIRSVVNWSWEGDKAKAAQKETGGSAETASGPKEEVGKLISGFMGKLTQKKGEEKSSPGGEKGAPFFSNTMEVKALSTEGIAADVFEIPAGYEKK